MTSTASSNEHSNCREPSLGDDTNALSLQTESGTEDQSHPSTSAISSPTNIAPTTPENNVLSSAKLSQMTPKSSSCVSTALSVNSSAAPDATLAEPCYPDLNIYGRSGSNPAAPSATSKPHTLLDPEADQAHRSINNSSSNRLADIDAVSESTPTPNDSTTRFSLLEQIHSALFARASSPYTRSTVTMTTPNVKPSTPELPSSRAEETGIVHAPSSSPPQRSLSDASESSPSDDSIIDRIATSPSTTPEHESGTEEPTTIDARQYAVTPNTFGSATPPTLAHRDANDANPLPESSAEYKPDQHPVQLELSAQDDSLSIAMPLPTKDDTKEHLVPCLVNPSVEKDNTTVSDEAPQDARVGQEDEQMSIDAAAIVPISGGVLDITMDSTPPLASSFEHTSHAEEPLLSSSPLPSSSPQIFSSSPPCSSQSSAIAGSDPPPEKTETSVAVVASSAVLNNALIAYPEVGATEPNDATEARALAPTVSQSPDDVLPRNYLQDDYQAEQNLPTSSPPAPPMSDDMPMLPSSPWPAEVMSDPQPEPTDADMGSGRDMPVSCALTLEVEQTTAKSSPPRVVRDWEESWQSSSASTEQEKERPKCSPTPGPRRTTLAHLEAQRKKLSTPFRSPTFKASKPSPKIEPVSTQPKMKTNGSPPPRAQLMKEDKRLTHRTKRAGGQFKSPLGLSSSGTPSNVRMTPTVQALEAKVQTLKRALKVKNDGDESILEDLTKRWRSAGQEVAYELFQLVRDTMDGEGNWMNQTGKKRKFDEGWGWDAGTEKNAGKFESSWGWDGTPTNPEGEGEVMEGIEDQAPIEISEEEKPEQTLGLMLRQMGIDPGTLGWNDEDGVFVD